MTANVNVTKVLFKRGNTVQNAAYTGINGEITVDTQAKTLRIHDGVTTGGNVIVAGGVVGSYSNTNAAAYIPTDSTITAIQSNVTAANAAIIVLQSNASTQQTQINLLNANVTAANTLIPNLLAISSNIIPSANVTYSLGSSTRQWKDLWVSNNTIYIGNVPITVSNGNLLVNGNLVTGSGGSGTDDVLRANVGAYQIFANANAATQATSINTFNANLGAYQTFANANAATQATSINSINANVGAYQTFANANAATQTTAIATLQTQVYANANVNTYLSSSVIGSLSTSGNLTVGGNLVVNGNSTIINTTSYTIEDNILQIADANPADTLDLGFVGHRTVASILQHTGLVRDASAGNWRLFSNVTAQPGNTVDFTNAIYDDLVVGNISANIVKNGNVWTFGTDGTTTFPTNISLGYGGNSVQFPRIIAPSGKAVSLQGQGSTGSAALSWSVDPDADTKYAAVGVSQGGGDNLAKVILTAGNTTPTLKVWKFDETGATTFPNSLILAPVSQSITMQSDQYSQLMWENANVTVAPNMAINSNFYVAQNSATLDIGYRDGSSTQLIKSWLWSVDGTLTLPTAGRINFDYLSISSDANVSAFYAPAGNVQLAAGIGDAQIVASSLSDSKIWNFGANANLTLPQTGYLQVGQGIVAGFASSPAPIITGFSNISAQNFTFLANGVNILSTVGVNSYGNTQVAAYLPTYSGNVSATNYLFANGVNILSTVGAGAYGNTQVAAYLTNYDGTINFTSSTAAITNVDVVTVGDNIQSPAYRFSNNVSIFDGISTVVNTKAPLATPTFSGTLTAGGNIVAQANVTVNNNLSVLGNLLVQGTTTTINATTLSITDKFITVANSSTNNSEANGAGIYVPGSSANILYTSVDDSWTLNKTIVGTGNIKATSWVTGNVFAYANGVNILADVTASMYANANVKAYLATAVGFADGYQRKIEGYYGNLSLGGTAQLYSYGATAKSYFGHDGFLGNTSINFVRADNGGVTIATNNEAYTWIFNNSGNLTLPTTANINFANGVSIFADLNSNAATQATGINTINANLGAYQTYANATFTGGGGTTYSNANVVSMLAANTTVFIGNVGNVATFSLQANNTQFFIGGNTVIASGNANVTNSTSLLHNMYFAANGTRLVRNTGAGVGTLSFDPTGFTVSGLVTVQTANAAPALPIWIRGNTNGLFAPSGFTTSTITASGTVAVNISTGIQTNQTTFALVNQTATTINFGGAATTINMGSGTIGGTGSNVFVGNAIGTSSGNLTVRAFGTYNSVNSLTSDGGYGIATYTNITVTGGSGTGMIISMTGVASGYLSSATVTNPGTGYRNGDTITIPAGNPVGSLGGSFVLGNYNAAYLGQVLANYTFGIDGNLTLPGNLTIAGAGSIRYANGVNYASTVTGTYSNTNVASYLTTATITTTGNITAGNLTTSGTYTVANITTTGTYGNITGANVISANTISATNYLFANGVNILSTVTGSYGNTQANALLSSNTVSAISTTGNITTIANLVATGNVYGSTFVGTTGVYLGNVDINGVTTLAGNLGVNGRQVTVFDSIIGLHTYANLTPWAADDGQDIGIRMHYYNAADKHAFLGLENTSKTLQFIIDATETSSNTTGTFGNVRFGSLFLSNTTAATSTSTGALQVLGGGGFAGNVFANNIIANVTPAVTSTPATGVGYIGMPQNATGSATLTIADAGRHIYVTSAGQTITIPAASSVPFPIGTTIAFIAGPSATTVSIAITTDTMYLGGTGTTGTRTLAAYGMATAVKVSGTSSSGVWYINGTGLT